MPLAQTAALSDSLLPLPIVSTCASLAKDGHWTSSLRTRCSARSDAILQGMVGAWESQCGKLDQYGMQHTRAFANLCNAGVAPVSLRAQVRVVLDQIQHLDMQLRFKHCRLPCQLCPAP